VFRRGQVCARRDEADFINEIFSRLFFDGARHKTRKTSIRVMMRKRERDENQNNDKPEPLPTKYYTILRLLALLAVRRSNISITYDHHTCNVIQHAGKGTGKA
jgi:hypothetical protein